MTSFIQRTGLAVAAVGGLLAATALTSTAALAGPTTTVDGVTIPLGSVPGGFYIDAEQSYETVVLAHGDTFGGVFKVQGINDAFAHTTYNYGDNGAFLTGVFSGFTANVVTAPTSTTAGTITFTGGSIQYYVETSDVFTNNAGQANDFANASSGKLWLNATPAVIDGAGDTLVITIPALNSLSTFSGASAFTLLDVNTALPGDAGALFNTDTFANSATGGTDDILFQGSADSGAAGDFPISGTNHIKANVVPEPASLALLSGGLLGFGWFARRRQNRV